MQGKADFHHFEGRVFVWDEHFSVRFRPIYLETIKADSFPSADSNEALVRKLPSMLKEVSPSHSNKTFDTFYKFCFNYFKPADVKNITMEVAQELFTSLLDVNRYSLSWTPSEENANECGEKEGDFPHRKAFVDFLGQSSLQVITRDQYEQFLPFNKHVPWDLVGFNEEESTCKILKFWDLICRLS